MFIHYPQVVDYGILDEREEDEYWRILIWLEFFI